MPSLRVMGFNLRLLPKIAESGTFDPAKLLSGETAERVSRICTAINADSWPDVIAFAEAWSDRQASPARDALINGLIGNYPHITPQLPGSIDATAGRFIDSGLMLLSRHPFISLLNPLPADWTTSDSHVGFVRFGDSANADAMATKGAGLVRIEMPSLGVFTVVFTHLQAAYATPDQYAGERAKQLAVIDALLRTALGSNPSGWNDEVIVLGDFNIAAIAVPQEYGSAFGNNMNVFGTNLKDGWATWMPSEDPGFTQDAWDQEQHDRLDYIFVGDILRKARIPIVAQHMRTVHRELSDHFALRADLNHRADYATPSKAFVAVARLGQITDQPPFEDQLLDGQQMRWLALRQPGTYTIVTNEEIAVEVFDARNISDPIAPYRTGLLDLSGIPGTEVIWRDRDLNPRGRTYAVRGPSYVRAFARDESLPTPIRCCVGWHRHGGTSAEDAISLGPQEPLRETDFKVGEKLNDLDVQWFSCWIGNRVAGLAHSSTFRVHNATGEPVDVSLRAGHSYLLPEQTFGQGETELVYPDAGNRLVHFLVKRSSPDQGNVHVGWRTALTYAAPPFRLRCDDETGPDWLGSDEITVEFSADGYSIGKDNWNDADTGEAFNPNLPSAAGLGFDVYVTEHDTLGDDHGDGHINGLPADQIKGQGEVGFKVGSGHYTFRCALLRAMPGD